MSIESPVGTLDIKNATLRVGRLEVSNIQGIDTALNFTRANSVLIYDDQASTTTFTGTTSSAGVRDTVNGYLDVADGYVYWGQKLPNSWVMDFEMDIRSGTNAGSLYANVFSTTNTGGDGYSFTFNDSNDKITLKYDGTTLTESTVSGLFTASESWQKVVINYERGLIAISVGGSRKFYYKDIERETPYTTGEYISFSSASTDGRKIRDLRIVNGEKWVYAGESNVVYTQGSVGVGVTDPTTALDVSGTVKATALEGDGSAITNISSANVGDFASNVTRIETLETDLGSNATRVSTLETDLGSNVTRIGILETDLGSNVTRIGTLETDLGSNVTRIGTLETDLGSNVTRIGTLETDLGSNVARIGTLETDLGSNVTRITSIESGDHTFTGIKTFENDVVLESNLRVQGDLLVANTVNMTVSDPILELGSNNLNTGDIGLVMTRHGASNSNVAVFFDETADTLKLGYTLNGANDTTLELDSNALTVSVQGALTAASVSGDGSGLTSLNASNVSSGILTRPISTTTGTFSGNVGIGTASPIGKLDVRGAIIAPVVAYASNQDAPYLVAGTPGYNGDPGNTGNWNLHGFQHRIKTDSGGTPRITVDAGSGGEVFTIRNGGNVGIGTASPAVKLDVSGQGRFASNGGTLQLVGTDHTYLEYYPDGTSAGRKAYLGYGSSSDDNFTIHNDAGSRHIILSGGNVGIGTTNPVSKLEISLDSETGSSNTVGLTIQNYSSDYTSVANGFGSRIQFKTNRGSYPTSTLDSADIKGYIYSGAGTTGDYHALDLDVYGDNSSLNRGISILSQSTSGGPANTIMYGNVGIGTTSPTSNLHVVGTTRASQLYHAGVDVPIRWASVNSTAFPQNDGQKYWKIARFTGTGGNYGRLQIIGTLGSDILSRTTSVNAFITTRGGLSVHGILEGYGVGGNGPKNYTDIVVYEENDGTHTAYLKTNNYYKFDILLLGGTVDGFNLITTFPCPEVSGTNVTPTGTLVTDSLIDECNIVFGSNGNVGIGTTNPSAQLTLGASSGSQIQVTDTTRLFSNTHYLDYGTDASATFEQVLLQFDTGGTGDTDQSEYAGYMDVEMVAQRTQSTYNIDAFTARLNFMLGWHEQSDFWQVKTFIQENTGRQDNYRSLVSTPVFKYKYVDRQLQIYVSFDARQCRSYTSFTARVTSDNPADVSTPGADALMASGTVGTAEVGICYGVGTNAANVGIGTTNPTSKLHVFGDVQLNDIFTINSSVGNIKKKTFTHYNSNGSTRYWKVASGTYDGIRRNQIKMVVNIHRVDYPNSTHRLVMEADTDALTFLPCIDEHSAGTPSYPRDLRVYKNTSDNTFDIYIQVSSYTYVAVEVLYSGTSITLYDTPTWTTTEPTTSGTYTLEFTNGNLNAMKIDNTGNVGIGTTSPLNLLHLSSDNTSLDASGSATFDEYSLIIHNTRGSGSNNTELGLCFNHYDTSYPSSSRTPGAAITHERIDSWSKGKLHFKTKSGNTEAASCDTRMTIDAGGNIGIGTTSPVGKLHLYQSGNGTNMIDKRTNISTSQNRQTLNYTHYSSVAQGPTRDPDNSRGLWIGNMVDENDSAPSGANFVAFTNSFQFYVVADQTKYDDGLSFISNTDTLKYSGGNFIKAMHIDSGGNVGIGTDSPGAKLDVNGNIGATHVSLGTTRYPTLGGNWLTIFSPTYNGAIGDNHPDPDGGILFTNQSSGGSFPWGYYMGVVKDVASTNGTTQRFDIGKSNDLNTSDYTSGADTLTPYLTIDNGNVGIGTTSPDDVFETYDSVGRIKITRSANNNNYGCSLDFALLNSANAKKTYARIGGSIADNTSGSEDGFLSFQVMTNGVMGDAYQQDKMRITSGGNVGIGTTNPTHQLHIGPKDNDHIYLASSNNSYGWTIDTDDQGSGTVPFRIIKRTGDVDSTVLTIKNQDGNVGIGTTSPGGNLEVAYKSASSLGDGTIRIGNYSTSSTYVDNIYSLRWSSQIGMGPYSTAKGIWSRQGIALHVEANEEYSVKSSGWSNLFGIKGGSGDVYVKGNVGIGTTSPGYQLDVNGSMRVGSSTDYMYFLSSGTMAHGTRMNSSTETRFIYLGLRNTTGTAYYMVNAGSSSSSVSWGGYPGVWASGNGEYRIHGNGASTTCAVRADGGHLTFTGSHDTFTPFSEEDVGKIVCSTGEYSTELKNGVMYNELTVMDSCPIVTLATKDNDKRVMGVLSRRTTRVETERISEEEYDALPNKTNYEKLPSESNVYTRDVDTGEFSRGCYNAVGEGGIWVTNKNGVFENGDYIVSSTIPGYGQKQNDDLLHNFTVAKITSDCDFTDIQVIKQRHTSVDGIYQYNENGEPIRENVLDENGNTITFSKFKLRYLLPDGTQITKEEYALAAEAYIAAFVGCTYHCG